MEKLNTPFLEAFYRGSKSAGPLPACIYLALSAQESLLENPYNTIVDALASENLRIFSFSLPDHTGGESKFSAIATWAKRMREGQTPLEEFIEKVLKTIEWLIDQGLIDPKKIAIGGLSRGGFLATHIAAYEKRIKILFAFAPVTTLTVLEDFASISTQESVRKLDLSNLTSELLHLKKVRFMIGTRDTRVSTDACYGFIRAFTEKAHEKRVRDLGMELILSTSIGHKGHGTSPETFEGGANFVKQQLLGA